MEDLPGGFRQAKLLAEKCDAIKASLCTEFMIAVVVPGYLLRLACQLEIALGILHGYEIVVASKLEKQMGRGSIANVMTGIKRGHSRKVGVKFF